MDTTFPLLRMVTEHYCDTPWLLDNQEDLLNTIKVTLANKDYQSQAVDALLLTFPCIIPLGNIKQWIEALRDGFDIYLGDDDLNSLGSIFLTNTQTSEIDEEVTIALRRVRKRVSPPLMLEAYINLLQLQVYRLVEGGIDDNVILSAIDLARLVNEQASYARLYRALSYAYVRRGYYDHSLKYAQMAYDYYIKQERPIEVAISAYALALNYRHKNELEHASHWLDIASENFSQTDYPRQFAVIAVEKGNIHMMNEDYQKAYQWLKIANQEVQLLDPHRRATIQHSYGIAQTDLGFYEEAEDSLNLSLRYWQDINDEHQIAHVLYALAFWAYKQELYPQALDYLDQSETIYDSIENNPFNGQIRKLIHNLRQIITDETA